MPYTELSFPVTIEDAPALSDVLMEIGALSVDLEDLQAGSIDEQPLFGEPGEPISQVAWQQNLLRALFENDASADAALLRLLQNEWLDNLQQVRRKAIAEQDWVRVTQSQFSPIQVDERLWVRPSWSQFEAPSGSIVLELDPGLAFGTGSHATTAMCMRWLLTQALAGQSVLDYGCGSGILGILACRLGAAQVQGVDLDPHAVEATRENVRINLTENPSHSHAATMLAALPASITGQRFDVVVANILSNPLKVLAPLLASHGKPGGSVALSGILLRQAQELIACYEPYADLQIFESCEDWVCLAGRWK